MQKVRNLALVAVAFVALIVPASLVVFFVGRFRASPPAVATLTATVMATTDTPLPQPATAAATRTPQPQAATPLPSSTPSPTAQPEPITLMALGIGTYAGENEVESVYLIDVDPAEDTVTITTFAPSILVDVDGGQKKLKLVYPDELSSVGGDQASATDAVAQALADNFGVAPDHYVTLREDSLISMVDAVGGIDVNTPAALGNIPAGEQHFDGETAWRYVGSAADPNVPSELERIQRQRVVFRPLLGKFVSPDVISQIPRLVRQFSADDAMRTDLSAKEIVDLMRLLDGVSENETHFIAIGDGLG